jgi:AhpD family alkylhydroperoxidase
MGANTFDRTLAGTTALKHPSIRGTVHSRTSATRRFEMTGFPFPELDGEKEAESDIFPINLTRMLLHTQGQTPPYLKFALSFRNAKISPVVRERVIVRVGAVTGCDYQLVQHKTEALRTGTSQELLADLVNPAHQQFDDPPLTALVTYVDSLVTNIGARPDALNAVRKQFPDNEVAEITLLAGTYVLCAIFLKSLQLALDGQPRPHRVSLRRDVRPRRTLRRQQNRRNLRIHVVSVTPAPDRSVRESGLGARDQVNRSLLHNKANQRWLRH